MKISYPLAKLVLLLTTLPQAFAMFNSDNFNDHALFDITANCPPEQDCSDYAQVLSLDYDANRFNSTFVQQLTSACGQWLSLSDGSVPGEDPSHCIKLENKRYYSDDGWEWSAAGRVCYFFGEAISPLTDCIKEQADLAFLDLNSGHFNSLPLIIFASLIICACLVGPSLGHYQNNKRKNQDEAQLLNATPPMV